MNQEKSLKMKNMPLGELILKMSVPAMFSMLVQALYNIVDGFYVSSIDETNNHLTALGYAFPMLLLMWAFAFGIGVGTNVIIAKRLGERNNQEASNIAKTGLIMSICMGVIFFFLSFIIVKPFLSIMSDIDEVVNYGTQYLTIIMMFSIGMFVEIGSNKIIQGTGQMILPMIMQLTGAITNIIIDPAFIHGFWFIPAYGIKGAAYATIISQWIGMSLAFYFLFIRKIEISLSFKHFKLKLSRVYEIIKIGTPVFMMNSMAAFTNLILHRIINIFDPSGKEIANTVFITYIKLQSFVFMPIFGLNQGGMPILSYNFGANNKKRYYKAAKIFVITATSLMIFYFIIFQLFSPALIRIFSDTDELIDLAVRAFRIISFGFIPAAMAVMFSMMFQSSGRGKYALLMSLLRQVIILIPLIYLIGLIGGIKYLWFAYPIAEFIVMFSFIPILKKSLEKSFIEREIFYQNNIKSLKKED